MSVVEPEPIGFVSKWLRPEIVGGDEPNDVPNGPSYPPEEEPRRLRVYIAGPIAKGDLAHNVNQAGDAFGALAKAGLAPLCPHWSVFAAGCVPTTPNEVVAIGTAMGRHDMTHADWMGVDLPWVAVSDVVLRLPGESAGADLEVAEAGRLGIPVFRTVEEVVEWSRTRSRS